MNEPDDYTIDRLGAREQEQAVLGALLIDGGAFDRLGELREEDFFSYDSRLIFSAIAKLALAARPVDVVTVFEALHASGKADQTGGLPYLNQLAQSMASSANIAHYAAIVRDKSIKRGLISLCSEMQSTVYDSPDTGIALVDQLADKVEALGRTTVKGEPTLAAEDLVRHIESIDARFHGAESEAISTGLPDLDAKLNGGLRRGNLIVLAARPKMGKTGLALNIACHVAQDKVAMVCSMEMTKSELHDRNIANIGHIHLDHLIDPKQMTDIDWPRLTQAVSTLQEMKLFLDDQAGLRMLDIRAKAKQVKRRAGLDLLVIDYLQLMNGEGDNRNAQIEGITRGLKNLAKELDIAIILLSQLNRKLEDRPNKRPQPADLRDSGSIEQDCDVAIFLYRDEVYNPESLDKGICEANVALNRQGASGAVNLVYIGEQTRFETCVHPWHPPLPRHAPMRTRGFSADA